ncbi:MAG: UDP-N-acetyl-D-mannosamine dehydrogenase [Parasphingorhabdus sp.]
MKFKKICVVGLGYIGLPTATIIASRKHHVVGLDVNPKAVESINNGQSHIVEPELDEMLHAAVSDGYLTAISAAKPADAFLIAVPTPFKNDHEPDISYIEAAVKAIAPVLQPGNLVVLESTSPVGTTQKISEWLADERPDMTFPHICGSNSDIRISHCPERVLPGKILRELVSNDRVIGGLTPQCSELSKELYEIFVEGNFVCTDARTAEMCKLAENSFRDVNIAFANELSLICDKLGIEVWELIELANLHPRVNILQPGPGVGGHCIAVDPWFIIHSAPEEAKLIKQARLVNDGKPDWVVDKVDAAAELLRSRDAMTTVRVACLGLAFKPNIDDLRESPAVDICEVLSRNNALEVLAVEPHIEKLPKSLDQAAKLTSAKQAIAQADIVLLLVDHSAFKDIPLESLSGKQIIDVRGFWSGKTPV